MDSMAKYLSKMDQEQVENSRREQLAFEKELFGQKLKFNSEMEGKSSSNTNENTSHEESQEQGAVAKLLKLMITTFNGTNLDWTRFWGQFTKGIDRSNIAAILKFSYLKEFVIPKVRKSMDGLPFTPEGYEKAKSVLKEHYGNDRKVEKAYVKDILDLPEVSGNQSPKIQFYEWLL